MLPVPELHDHAVLNRLAVSPKSKEGNQKQNKGSFLISCVIRARCNPKPTLTHIIVVSRAGGNRANGTVRRGKGAAQTLTTVVMELSAEAKGQHANVGSVDVTVSDAGV